MASVFGHKGHKPFEAPHLYIFRTTGLTLMPARRRFRGARRARGTAGSLMAFVQFTQPDDQPIVINTERIITAAPAPPDGQGTRITFTNGRCRRTSYEPLFVPPISCTGRLRCRHCRACTLSPFRRGLTRLARPNQTPNQRSSDLGLP